MIQPAMTFISNLNYVAIAVIGGIQVANGQMSLGDVPGVHPVLRQFTFPIIQVASIANVLQSAVASAERVFELLDEAEEVPDPVAPRDPRGAGRGPRHLRGHRVPLRGGQAAHRGPVARRGARPDRRHRRARPGPARPRSSTC